MGIPEIRSVVSRLGREYGAQRIWLFGSYARGDMTPASDIDLRIDKGRIRGIEMGGLLLDLEEALGVPVDLVPTGSLTVRAGGTVCLFMTRSGCPLTPKLTVPA